MGTYLYDDSCIYCHCNCYCYVTVGSLFYLQANVSEKPDEILGNDGSDFMHISYEILMNHSSDSFNGDLTLAFIPNHKLKTVRLDFKGDDISSPSLYYNISNDDQIESSANTSANHSVGSDSSLIRSLVRICWKSNY